MIEALWIDDECMSNGVLTAMGVEFIETAYKHGIKVTPVLTYKEGIDLINKNPLQWCAVILDIHNQKATTRKASDDFVDANEQIIRFQVQHNQREPYIFVLSGNKQYKTDFSLIKQPDYCQKNIYDKSGKDYELLFSDIVRIQSLSKLYACQEEYRDVLTIAKNFCGEETWQRLLKVLHAITICHVKNNPALFNDMRKILEDIMLFLKKCEYSYFEKNEDNISLNKLSVYIGKDTNIPEYIQRAFHTLDRVVQDGSHSERVDCDVANSRAPYLLRSCVYELCNILIWMRSLV